MIIKRKRIHRIDPYVKMIPTGNNVVVGVVNPLPEKLKKIGFSPALENGESVLPLPVGRVSMFNAEGKYLIQRDHPKEIAYRTVEWFWTEWHGKDRVEKSDFRDVPYERHPRTFVPPPGLELTLATDTEGNQVVRTPVINWINHKASLVHAVNLLLEIFGECSFYNGDMRRLIKAPIKRLNWRVLPLGQRPWATLKQELSALLEQVKKGKRAFTQHRLETINKYKPDFAAVGEGGFKGYVILGFTNRNTYILESLLYGNATYVFGERWEELSKKTKAEILNHRLQRDRFIHHRNWESDIRKIFKVKKSEPTTDAVLA